MAVRKDGIESKENLLKAASEVFAENGYRNSTVAQICRKAGSNIAAVNYHFSSKDELYIAVWRSAFEQAMKVYPPDGGIPETAAPRERLAALIKSALHRILDDGKLGCAGQILLRELGEPSEVINPIIRDVVAPLRRRLENIISQLLGTAVNEESLMFCQLSIVHQCLAMGFRRSKNKLPPIFKDNVITKDIIDRLAEHITIFSLAGIAAVREKIESQQESDNEK